MNPQPKGATVTQSGEANGATEATFVPIVLTRTEAIAAAAACMAVATSGPLGAAGPGHPLFEAGLKIEAARKAADA